MRGLPGGPLARQDVLPSVLHLVRQAHREGRRDASVGIRMGRQACARFRASASQAQEGSVDHGDEEEGEGRWRRYGSALHRLRGGLPRRQGPSLPLPQQGRRGEHGSAGWEAEVPPLARPQPSRTLAAPVPRGGAHRPSSRLPRAPGATRTGVKQSPSQPESLHAGPPYPDGRAGWIMLPRGEEFLR